MNKNSLLLPSSKIEKIANKKIHWEKHPVYIFKTNILEQNGKQQYYLLLKFPSRKSYFQFFLVGKNFGLQTISGNGIFQKLDNHTLTESISFSGANLLNIKRKKHDDYHLRFNIFPETETILLIGCEPFAKNQEILHEYRGRSLMEIREDLHGIYVFK